MKHCCAVFWIVGFFGLSLGEERYLTNRDGKRILAEIETVRAGEVYLRVGANRFRVPFHSLSDEDQAFLREWVKSNFDYRFQFRVDAVEDIPSRQSERSGDTKEEKSKWRYSVDIENRSGVDANNLRVEYRVFERQTQIDDLATSGKSKRETGNIREGTSQIETLANTGKQTIETEWFDSEKRTWKSTSTVIDSEGLAETKYNNHETSRELDGIWLRIFVGERMVAEYKSEGKMIKKMDWDGRVVAE